MKTPTMTRKHFEFIAEVIKGMPDHSPNLRAQKRSTAESFAENLRMTNSLFDRPVFMAACGIPEN